MKGRLQKLKIGIVDKQAIFKAIRRFCDMTVTYTRKAVRRVCDAVRTSKHIQKGGEQHAGDSERLCVLYRP